MMIVIKRGFSMNEKVKKRSFIKKWQRQIRPLRIFYLLINFGYLISLIFFTISLVKLSGIETTIRVIALVILYIHLSILSLGGLIYLFTNRKKRLIFLLILSLIYIPVLSLASHYIDRTYNIIDNVQKRYVEYTSVMVSLSETQEYNRIGMISAKDDPTGYIIPKMMIEEYDISGEIVEYDDYISMMSELYDGEIDALFVADGYTTMFSTYEKFASIAYETKTVYKMTKELENVDNVTYSTKSLTEPFTVLLMGVDSTGDGISASSSFNGDSLMMITFNPKTLNATVFSIPRDTYVPIACRQGAENKINSSAYGGTSCVVDTIEDLTGIDIDYYVKINFTGVVNLVDDLGGISLDVPMSFCEQDSQRRFGEYMICLEEGYQTLNGEEALALARHRHSLPLGDFQRVQNQQLVVEAMVRELKNIESVNEFYQILDDAAKNVDTNMSTSQILSLYSVGKNILINTLNSSASLSIEKTYLTGYDLTMYMDSTKSFVYTFQYYRQSLADIVNLMKSNLEIEKPTLIKTFSFDVNETYEKSVTGKKYYNETRRELLPNFVGNTQSYVEAWATERGIKVNITKETSILPNGQVISQNEHNGKLVESIRELNIVVSDNTNADFTPSTEDPTLKNESDQENDFVPDFTGMSITEFNKWKNSLNNANLIIDIAELTIDDILTLGETDLKENTIYKQSAPKGTKIDDISSLIVYYYKGI